MAHAIVLILFATLPTGLARYKAKQGEEWVPWAVGAIVGAFIGLALVNTDGATVNRILVGCSHVHGPLDHFVFECAAENLHRNYGLAPVVFWMAVGFFIGDWWSGRAHSERAPLTFQGTTLAESKAFVPPNSADDKLLDALDKAIANAFAGDIGAAGVSPVIRQFQTARGVSSRDVAAVLVSDEPSKADVARVGQALSRLSNEGRVERIEMGGRPLRWRRA